MSLFAEYDTYDTNEALESLGGFQKKGAQNQHAARMWREDTGNVTQRHSDDGPSSVEQLAAAMKALGMYSGENTSQEHAAEARHLGGTKAYRARLANALLGCVEVEVMLADGDGLSDEHIQAAHQQALQSAGVAGYPSKLLHFLRWRAVRIAGPLREIARNEEVGPLPLAAARAIEGFQLLLGVCAAVS